MGGPAYVPIKGNKSPFRFPNSYAGKPLFYEWTRDYIKMMELNKQGRLKEIDGFAPFVDNPMDIEWGPDGSMYVLEYGDGYFAENPDAQLSKINYVRGNRSPIVKVSANPAGGAAPLTVQFSTAGTTDPDGDTLKLRVGLRRRRQGRQPRPAPGVHLHDATASSAPVVKVTDETKRTASADVLVLVGNQDAGRSSWSRPRSRTIRSRRSSSARRSPTRSRSPTTRRWTARRSPWPTSSATSATATRSPRRRAAPARSPCRWTRATPARRT